MVIKHWVRFGLAMKQMPLDSGLCLACVRRKLMKARYLLLAILVTLAVACVQLPKEFHYQADMQAAVWPAPPERARYQFVGYLTGEDNFRLSKDVQENKAVKVLRWIVGLGERLNRKDQLVRPQSGTVSADGRILVTDVGTSSVFVFDTLNGVYERWTDAKPFVSFNTPIGIVVTNDNVLVADAELGEIFRLSLDGEPIDSFGRDVLQRPTGLTYDPLAGELYVADTTSHDVKVFNEEGELLRVVGSAGKADGQFNRPTYLSHRHNKLYVTDSLNARAQIFNTKGEVISSIGQRGLYMGNITHPKGVAVDSDENIYITESFYDYLLIFNQQGQFLLPIGGNGSGFGQFFLPAGVWVDQSDHIYIADMLNGRVMVLKYLGGQV